ncbi:MAG: alpha/beta fold hydrolase [Lysobacterales bacterium]
MLPPKFPDASGPLVLRGAVGAIEAVIDVPEPADVRLGTVIVCHPHPLHGGTLHNKVVTILERSLRECGLRTLRFNFRGVGASEGTHDDGAGEADDLQEIAQWVMHARPQDALWLAGFSFGAAVAAHASIALPCAQLITVAPPVDKYGFESSPPPTCPWLLIQGEDDDVVEPAQVYAYVEKLDNPPTLVKMPGAGHFFHRKLMDLRGALKNGVKANLPPPDPASNHA